MTDKNIIILETPIGLECWGCLTELCDNHKLFSYHYLKKNKFPFECKGYIFHKVKYRKKIDE